MSNKLYDCLKWIDLTFIPALIVFMGVLANVFHWGWGQTAMTVMGAFDVFLGSLIGVSSAKYNKSKEDDDSGTNL